MKYRNRRSSNAFSSNADFLDADTELALKRNARIQKRLEKKTGATIIDIDPTKNKSVRNKTIKLESLKEIKPLTERQGEFIDAYYDDVFDAFVLCGSAGTGKTFLAMNCAIADVLDPKTVFDKLVIVRSSVQSREQGHLPGDIAMKMEAFEAPYKSIFSDLFDMKDAYEKLKDMGKIEFVSTSFLRGSSYNNTIIVFDENQNASWEELKTVATRLGKDSRIIFCGDTKQNDLHFKKTDVSGINDFLRVTSTMKEFKTITFQPEDIVRSKFVKQWIIACERMGL